MADSDLTVAVEVWVLVDEDGQYVADTDPDHIAERYDEEIGEECRSSRELRRIKVTLTVPLPRPVALVGTVPELATSGELKVA